MTIWTPALSSDPLPKYLKLANAIDAAIKQGELKENEKLPPQRRLADVLSVTVGTVTRAYAEAEQRGSVEARVGSGTYVKADKSSALLSAQTDDGFFDLQSAKAPMGPQLEMMQQSLKTLANEKAFLEHCLLYQAETGLPHQREVLANWLNSRGFECDQNQLLFCYGGQHGISLALQVLCRAGDTVLAEGLSFPGISAACQQQQLKCIGLRMDQFGITPEALTAACVQSHPRVLYLTAQIQNPTSIQMPLERKLEIIEICKQHKIVIIDDDVQFLPQADKQKSFYQLNPENTIYLSSFSKSYSGGVRVGYLLASQHYQRKLQLALRASCWTIPSMMIEIICRWLQSGEMQRLERWLSNEMSQRNKILKEILSDFEISFQPRGFNAWLTLPEHWRAVDFVHYAKQQKVLIRAAESYAVGRFPAPQNIRICTGASKDQQELSEALNLLKKCLFEKPISDQMVM